MLSVGAFASTPLPDDSGSCDAPASLEPLSPAKRALVEQRCRERAIIAAKKEDFYWKMQTRAAFYFTEKPALREVYDNSANMVCGFPGGFDETDCDLDDLVTVFCKAMATGAGITWIDRASSDGGCIYLCERYDFPKDGSDFLDYQNYHC